MSESVLQRVAGGDMSAMQECIDEYGGLIWSLARRYSPSPAEAEDAVQEVFIALWESAERFDPAKGAEVTFVAMIARRRIIDRGRRFERRERVVTEVRTRKEGQSEQTTDPLSTSDEARKVLATMEELSDDQQRVLHLAVHQGCTHEQISKITQMPLGTVKTHARRGLMRIREVLARDDTPGSGS